MTILSEGGPKTCPACGLIAPASTPRCDCGYAFRGDLSALESPGPKSIGGWLILVALGVCAAPIRIIGQTTQLFPVFEADTWKALTTPGEAAYHPLWAPWIIAELITNLVLFAGSIVLACLFFAKRRLFPRFAIYFMLAERDRAGLRSFGHTSDPRCCEGHRNTGRPCFPQYSRLKRNLDILSPSIEESSRHVCE